MFILLYFFPPIRPSYRVTLVCNQLNPLHPNTILLNFYSHKQYLYNTILCVFTVLVYFFAKNGFPIFIDFFSRANLCDFFINNYYYFWTTFWLIPTTLLITLFFNITRLAGYVLKLTLLFIIILFVFIYEIVDYTNLNQLNYMWTLNTTNVNLLLTNSINKYHPFIFYYTLLSLMILYYFSRVYSNSSNHALFLPTCGKFWRFMFPGRVYFSITFTLFLGSWWALQEGSWGGWWNWDPSEVFGLLIMIYVLMLLHFTGGDGNVSLLLGRLGVVLPIIISVYVFIQLNFNLVSHNFGIKVADFINTSQSFLVLYCLLLTLVFYNTRGYFFTIHLKLSSLLKTGVTIKILLNFTYYTLLYTLITLSVALSFYPLLVDFLNKTFGIKSLNWLFSYEDFIYIVLVCTIVYFWVVDFFTGVLVVLLVHGSVWLCWPGYIIIFISNLPSFVHKFHKVSKCVLLVSVYNYSSNVLGWVGASVNNYLVTGQSVIKYSVYQDFWAQNNSYLRLSLGNLSQQCNLLSPTSFYHNSTSLEVPIFSLINTGNLNLQSLYSNTTSKLFNVDVFDLSIITLTTILLVSFYFIVFFFRKKTIIVY